MDYLAIYNNLIRTRKERVPADGVYYENHHIVMKSMGGKNDPENLVKLTAREHFLAHWLLWRIHRNRETAYSFNLMKTEGKFRLRKKNFSSIAYAEAKEAISEMGHSEETCKKIGNANRRRTYSAETLEKMRNSAKKRKISAEGREKLKKRKNSMQGRTHSEASKQKMREAAEKRDLTYLIQASVAARKIKAGI